jgi:hypothetical protein
MALQKYVDEWPETHPEAHTLAVDELRVLPHVVKREGEQIEVVFEAKAGSRLWKDVMVALVHDVPTEAGVEFEGFCDLVGGGFRPAWPDQA